MKLALAILSLVTFLTLALSVVAGYRVLLLFSTIASAATCVLAWMPGDNK